MKVTHCLYLGPLNRVGDGVCSLPQPFIVRVKVPQGDDAPGPMPEDPPDRGHVRPRGRQEGGGRVAQPMPAAAGDAGPVTEAVEGLRERRIGLREAGADGAGAPAVALQDVTQRRRDREAKPPAGLVPGARNEAGVQVDLLPREGAEIPAGEAGEEGEGHGDLQGVVVGGVEELACLLGRERLGFVRGAEAGGLYPATKSPHEMPTWSHQETKRR